MPERADVGSSLSGMKIVWVTGTGTGVGKTVVTALLAASLRDAGRPVLALKPLCSGGRSDAVALRAASGRTTPLDAINPWHYRVPLAPPIAAEVEKKKSPGLAEVLAFIRKSAAGEDTVLVEGAGGLLSPMGRDFTAVDLIRELQAEVVVVAKNQLGVINDLRLTRMASPVPPAVVALIRPQLGQRTARTNLDFLRSDWPAGAIVEVPWMRAWGPDQAGSPLRRTAADAAAAMWERLGESR